MRGEWDMESWQLAEADKRRRRYLNELMRHPDPRDPDHPEQDEEEDEQN